MQISRILVLLGFLAAGTGGASAYFLPVFTTVFRQSGQEVRSKPQPAPAPSATSVKRPSQTASSQEAFTVLLLGSDNDPKFQGQLPLTQSMILVRVDPAARKVVMLSIPRDLYVPLAGGGVGKIDQAYENGGPASALQTVENNFNVHIDDYVWVGLEGLIKLIDLVGGVDVTVTNPVMDDLHPADIKTENPYGYHRLAIFPGAQHMDGVRALEYVRSRHSDARQDFGRSFRQQQVLVALRSKAKSLNPADLPMVAASLQGQIATSVDLKDLNRLQHLLWFATQVKPADINQIVMVDGYTWDAKTADDQDILEPNWPLIQGLVHQYFPR
jgi:LCP family protein required for cell wall assembly